MEWPYRRFLKAFDSFQRRIICDEWRDRKIAHICALHANQNWDSEDNHREEAITRLEESYNTLIARIWNGTVGDDGMSEEEKEAWESPLIRAGRKAAASIGSPVMPGQAALESLPI